MIITANRPRQGSEDRPPNPPPPTPSLRASASATTKAWSPTTALPSPNSATARPAASSPSNCARRKPQFGVTCIVDWRLTTVEAAPVEKPKAWPKSLLIFKRALLNALTDFGMRIRPFADNLEVLGVDREKVRAEFMRAYPADNRKAKGEAFRRSEIDAVERGFIVSRSIGEDLAATVLWLVRDDP